MLKNHRGYHPSVIFLVLHGGLGYLAVENQSRPIDLSEPSGKIIGAV